MPPQETGRLSLASRQKPYTAATPSMNHTQV